MHSTQPVHASRYERKDGNVVVIKGKSRYISVDSDHPAARAMEFTKELGGEAKATPSGTKLFDKEGRQFAMMTSKKEGVIFYMPRVSYSIAHRLLPDIGGNWGYCWPDIRKGCATLRNVDRVTKSMIKSLMRLSAAHAVDHRKQTIH